MPVDFRPMDKALIKAFGSSEPFVFIRAATSEAFEFTPIREDPAVLEGAFQNNVNLPLFCDPEDFGDTPPVKSDKVMYGSSCYDVLTVDYDEAGGLTLGLRKAK